MPAQSPDSRTRFFDIIVDRDANVQHHRQDQRYLDGQRSHQSVCQFPRRAILTSMMTFVNVLTKARYSDATTNDVPVITSKR